MAMDSVCVNNITHCIAISSKDQKVVGVCVRVCAFTYVVSFPLTLHYFFFIEEAFVCVCVSVSLFQTESEHIRRWAEDVCHRSMSISSLVFSSFHPSISLYNPVGCLQNPACWTEVVGSFCEVISYYVNPTFWLTQHYAWVAF